jgi:hypothetical protein
VVTFVWEFTYLQKHLEWTVFLYSF